MKQGLSFFLLLLLIPKTYAEDITKDPRYYEIQKPKLYEITESEEDQTNISPYHGLQNPYVYSVTGTISSIHKIVQIGKIIYDIIKENKAVVNLKFDHTSAIPAKAKNVTYLSGWKGPKVRSFRMVYENGFGMEVVDFRFRLVYSYGASFEGKGSYLANVSIYPAKLSVAWGYTFNASTYIPAVLNIGTDEAPISALEMHLSYSIETPMKNEKNTISIFLDGEGKEQIYQ